MRNGISTTFLLIGLVLIHVNTLLSPDRIHVPAPTAQHRYVREVRELTDSDKPLGMPQEAGRVEYTAGNGQRVVEVWVRVKQEGGAE